MCSIVVGPSHRRNYTKAMQFLTDKTKQSLIGRLGVGNFSKCGNRKGLIDWMIEFIDLFIDWMINWLSDGCLNDWLIHWLIDRSWFHLMSWLIFSIWFNWIIGLVDWFDLICCDLIHWLIDLFSCIDWLIGRLID